MTRGDLTFNFICNDKELMAFFLIKSKFKYPYKINSQNTKNMVNVFLHESSVYKTFNVNGSKLNIYVSLEPYEAENKITDKFLNQFDIAVVSDDTAQADNIVKFPNYMPWLFYNVTMINKKHNLKFIEPKKQLIQPHNDRILLIASNKSYYNSHFDRAELLAKFKKSKLNSEIDYYGFGYQDFKSKIDLLPRYKHAIVLENSMQENYISEKLIDSVICGHNILYWGCPSVKRFLSYPYIQNITHDIDNDIEVFHRKYTTQKLPGIKVMRDRGNFSAYHEANYLHKIVSIANEHKSCNQIKHIKPNFHFNSNKLKKSIKLLRSLIK